ncbi:hypothetical protein BV22DRAFT_1080730 [Leucogyrophana mollusca]|uniref:Uncharacterized protein n=1 Tax=Leucogyrophana mollusca TaxID=85980 RepID=A0ACB8BUB9_9AGAM|nr:hypothetical protein BV22DRAFT_1080730 [Leucogyrophana mollusca]
MRPNGVTGFNYPITRPFTRRSTFALLIFAVVVLCGLVVLNIVLIDYDLVSVASPSFNVSQQLSWMLSLQAPNPQCQPYAFQMGDTFGTNISAFTYSVFDVATSPGQPNGSFPYTGDALSGCDVSQIQLTVSPGDRQITAQGSVNCSDLGFQASTSWAFTNHPIIGGIVSSSFPENSLGRAIGDTLYGFGNDAYQPIYNTQYVTTASPAQQLYKVIVQFQPGPCSDSSCNSQSPNLTIAFYNGISLTDLSIVADTGSYTSAVKASTATLQNLAQVFYAAVRLDLGHWTENNIFTNMQVLQATITPGPSYANSIVDGSVPPAYINMTSPPSADAATPSSVIQTQYTCTTPRVKRPGSLFMNVLSSSLAVFLAAWGVLTALMGVIARGRAGANSCTSCISGPEPGGAYSPFSPGSSIRPVNPSMPMTVSIQRAPVPVTLADAEGAYGSDSSALLPLRRQPPML